MVVIMVFSFMFVLQIVLPECCDVLCVVVKCCSFEHALFFCMTSSIAVDVVVCSRCCMYLIYFKMCWGVGFGRYNVRVGNY